MMRLISVRCLHFLIYLFKFSLTMDLAIIVQGTSIPVSEYKTKSSDDARMQCIPPTETVESSNDTYTCRMNATGTLVQEMGKTFAILEHIDSSSMTCLNGTTLHRGVMNWERNKTFDTCSYRIKIEAGYYLILSNGSNKITFVEQTKCIGNQTCPSESYYSDEIVPQYRKLDNGTYIWIGFTYIDKSAELPKQSTGSPDASPETVNSSPSHVTCPWCICLCVGILKIIL